MRKIIIALSICSVVTFSACKKETVTEERTVVNPDGSTVKTTTTTTDYNLMRLKAAEDNYKKAKEDVEAARATGDTKAERIAQDAADKAKEAWEITKREVKEGADKTGNALKKAGQDVKEGYNNALEKAKAE
jgi:uncharacterized cupredoxin-like copper-binding protein